MRPNLTDYQCVDEALADLCNGLYEPPGAGAHWQAVDRGDVPAPFDELLVHTDHMTTRLAAYHGGPVTLRVLDERREGDLYRRKIVLTPEGSESVIEFGIVRIDLSFVPDAVRSAIVGQSAPLGDILIRHSVLRRIDPRWFVKFTVGSPLVATCGWNDEGDVYGRVGTIYCNDQPAIELLEVVTGRRAWAPRKSGWDSVNQA